jgi:hypothetical protein
MKIGITKPVEVEAKELRLYCKVCDRFAASLHDQNGESLHDQEDGYVPGFMPGEHFGDYLILNIDIDTGQITNWQQPTAEQLQIFIGDEE